MGSSPEGARLTDVARPLMVYWRWVVAGLTVGAIAGWGASFGVADTYESMAELLYRDVVGLRPSGRPDRSEHLAAIDDEIELLLSDRVAQAARPASGVSVTRLDGGPVVRITTTASTPAAAADGASALVEAYLVERNEVIRRDYEAAASVIQERLSEVEALLVLQDRGEASVASDADLLRDRRDEYQATIDELEIAARLQEQRRVELSRPPTQPRTSASPSPLALASVGGLVGAVVAATGLILQGQALPRIHDRRGLALHLPLTRCLGQIPCDRSDAVALRRPSDRWGTSVALMSGSTRTRSLVILAASEADLPRSVALALARLFATGGDVSLIDIDPTNMLPAQCGVDADDVHRLEVDSLSETTLDAATVPVPFAEGVSLVAMEPARSESSGELLTLARLDELVDLVLKSGRNAIVVPASMGEGGPPLELQSIDAVVIASRLGQPASALGEQVELVEAAGLKLLGVVLVDRCHKKLTTSQGQGRN